MKLLLDTHALLWWSFGMRPLPARVGKLIEDARTEVFVSSASFWEMAIKLKTGSLRLPVALDRFCEDLQSQTRTQLLPVTAEHAVATLELALHHKDPFDRMLVAQCRVEGLALATADDNLSDYPVRIVW